MRLAMGVLLIYAVITLAAFAQLRKVGAVSPGVSMGKDRAAFLAVGAATGTAFELTIRRPTEYQPPAIAIVRGVGVCGVLLTLLACGVLTAQAIAPRLRAYVIVGCGVGVMGMAAMAGFLLSGSGWLAMACISGFGTLASGSAFPASPLAVTFYLPLMVLGSLGPAVWAMLATRRAKRLTVAIIAWTSGLWIITTLLLLAVAWTTAGGPFGAAFTRQLSSAAMTAMDARVTGLEPAAVDAMPRLSRWVLTLLAAVGTNVGVGGIGVAAVAVWGMTAGRMRAMAGLPLIAAWAGVWVVMAIIGVGWLSAAAPQLPFDQVLLLAISATSHVGLSAEPISLTGNGLWALTWTMALAKIGQLLVVGMFCHSAGLTYQRPTGLQNAGPRGFQVASTD